MQPPTEQIDALIQLQDIDTLLREARDPEITTHEERLGFALGNVKRLEKTRERVAGLLDERVLQTYERMSRRFTRVVVPVEGSVCQGCRMSLPTSAASRNLTVATIESCENCGRILYRP